MRLSDVNYGNKQSSPGQEQYCTNASHKLPVNLGLTFRDNWSVYSSIQAVHVINEQQVGDLVMDCVFVSPVLILATLHEL